MLVFRAGESVVWSYYRGGGGGYIRVNDRWCEKRRKRVTRLACALTKKIHRVVKRNSLMVTDLSDLFWTQKQLLTQIQDLNSVHPPIIVVVVDLFW